jgi:hypothetical protein
MIAMQVRDKNMIDPAGPHFVPGHLLLRALTAVY